MGETVSPEAGGQDRTTTGMGRLRNAGLATALVLGLTGGIYGVASAATDDSTSSTSDSSTSSPDSTMPDSSEQGESEGSRAPGSGRDGCDEEEAGSADAASTSFNG